MPHQQTSCVTRRLGRGDLDAARDLNRLFAEAFGAPQTYLAAPPDNAYLEAWLSKPDVIALVATDGDKMIGGLVAYVLHKLEQARSEIYIYDLAVAKSHRRTGVATMLIEAVKLIARETGAWVIFVQADQGDLPAIGLYDMLGAREAVLHFDISPNDPR